MTERRHRPIDAKAVEAARDHVLDNGPATEARRLLDCLCDPTRLNIVRALRAGPLAASDIAHLLDRTRSATSQHLRVLREVGAVVAERKGNVIRYRLGTNTAAAVLSDVSDAFDRVAAA
jgi:DNA-binding transcriptional ArsR family regulator